MVCTRKDRPETDKYDQETAQQMGYAGKRAGKGRDLMNHRQAQRMIDAIDLCIREKRSEEMTLRTLIRPFDCCLIETGAASMDKTRIKRKTGGALLLLRFASSGLSRCLQLHSRHLPRRF